MSDILKILNQATKPISTTKKYRAAQEKSLPYWTAVQKAFSTKFVNEMTLADGEVWELECQEHFTRGFWLGLRLGQFSEQGPSGSVGDF